MARAARVHRMVAFVLVSGIPLAVYYIWLRAKVIKEDSVYNIWLGAKVTKEDNNVNDQPLILSLQQYEEKGMLSLSTIAPMINTEHQLSSVEKETKKQNNNRTILFVHLSKSAGSSVCQTMAKEMTLTNAQGRIDRNRRNCNVQFLDKRHKWSWTEPHFCTELERFTTNATGHPHQRNNFIAIERPWHDEMPCLGFRSFSVMRHPVSRYISLIDYFGMNETFVMDYTKKQQTGVAVFDAGHKLAAHPTNSWTIRQLLGYKRFFDPNPIDNNDYLRARSLVEKFDALLPLEFLRHPNVLRMIKSTIPEYHKGLLAHNITVNKSKKTFHSAEFVDLLNKENKYDIMLYEYVLKMFDLKYTDASLPSSLQIGQ